MSAARLPASVITNLESGFTLSGAFSGNGSGLTLLNPANLNGVIPQASLGAINTYTPTVGNGVTNFITTTASGYYANVGNLVYSQPG